MIAHALRLQGAKSAAVLAKPEEEDLFQVKPLAKVEKPAEGGLALGAYSSSSDDDSD